MSLKITNLTLQPHLPRANKLSTSKVNNLSGCLVNVKLFCPMCRKLLEKQHHTFISWFCWQSVYTRCTTGGCVGIYFLEEVVLLVNSLNCFTGYVHIVGCEDCLQSGRIQLKCLINLLLDNSLELLSIAHSLTHSLAYSLTRLLTHSLYPPNNEVVGGYIGFTPSVRPSHLPCPLCNIYSSGWILSILATNDLYHERVCRTQWLLTLTYIFKVIRPWLRKSCPLCSVYSSGWILFIFGTKDHYHSRVCRVLVFIQNLKIWIFGKFLKFFSLALEKKNLQFSMDSFHI